MANKYVVKNGVGVLDPTLQINPPEQSPDGVPSPHSLQYFAYGHDRQEDNEVALVFGLYFPGGHGIGLILPSGQ